MISCLFPKKVGILFLEKLGSENYKQKIVISIFKIFLKNDNN